MTDTAVSGVLVLDRNQTRAALPPDELLAAVRTALISISRGDASVPPRVAARAPQGLLGAMPGYVPRLGLAAKLVTVFSAVTAGGHGAHRGIVAYFDEENGRPLAVMDAETITAVRTAVTATIAMRALARPDVTRIAVIGTGTQARAQIDLIASMTSAELLVGARNRYNAERLVGGLASGTATSIEAAAKDADVVFCCTSSREPVLHRSWLADGVHLSSVGGSDGPEFDADTLRASSLFVEWQGAVTEPPPAGAWELQGTDPADASLIGAVLDGGHPGRRLAEEMTIFKSTGHAALDVAAASVAYQVARERGLGFSVDL
ncbi:ornithine cyclodeaminase family protein [Streptosporangium sp. NBC_01639]|uniref:ornithine cyclodeaminase family protein n=1 Tax=Streptosporangium sp. NBC_01639 TaxID=2975948 RepID=UPI00386FF7E8|nr:ornithine cyclodeaminase family protein [Streptosporangium sp. NBC_01639]